VISQSYWGSHVKLSTALPFVVILFSPPIPIKTTLPVEVSPSTDNILYRITLLQTDSRRIVLALCSLNEVAPDREKKETWSEKSLSMHLRKVTFDEIFRRGFH